MTGVLVSRQFPAHAAEHLTAAAERVGQPIRWIQLPVDPEARLDAAALAAIDVAFYSVDIYESVNRSFFSAVRRAPKMRWLHVFNVGVDHPIFAALLAAGVRITTSAGTTAVPIAQAAIAGLLLLARGFLPWLEAQRRHEWKQMRGAQQPPDLAGQTLAVLGLGSIGAEIARLATALGLRVIGIRRSPRRADDPIDEIRPPSALGEVLARSQWLAIACPLTEETRRLIDARALASLPAGARVINVGRGEIVDEAALIDALASGHLGGAYLDVFEKEPLPPDSRLWDLSNVILSPHNAWAAAGNDGRVVELFVHNFQAWLQGRPLRNEVLRSAD